MSWLLVTRALPILPDREYLYPRSEPVMVFLNRGVQRVARYVRYDEDVPYSEGKWISECSEAWDLTDSVTHWRTCFEAPVQGPPIEPVQGYFLEPEQLKQLRLINQGLYGDGTLLSSDRRRDLANCLMALIGQVISQSVEV